MLIMFLIGLGYIAILPLFEGFDESAHFSSMRQIADTKIMPVWGKSYLDKETTDYSGPVAYGTLLPPFDKGMVYQNFFEHSELAANYQQIYRQPQPHPSFTASEETNWQSQHPPLYYLLLAPLEKATDHLSFVSQIFLLRLASYLLALVGVAFGLLAIRQQRQGTKMSAAMAGFMMYPIMLPMFFPEFARMGNDSLCILWVGVIAYLLSRWLRDEHSRTLAIAIGVALGLGLLTKAFFVPITAALVTMLLLRVWQRKSLRGLQSMAWMLSPALLIGAGWYVYQAMIGGSGMEGEEAISLAQHGGLLVNLREHFTLFGLARGIVSTGVTWIWAGTWSLVRLHSVLYVPLLILVVWVSGAYLLELRKYRLSDSAWLPVWLFAIFGAGLMYHILIGLALVGIGATAGWYLHILMPLVAPAIGLGTYSIWKKQQVRYGLIGLLAYAILFQGMALWAQFSLFTGCATKGANKLYAFSGHSFCLAQAPTLVHRIAILGWPVLGGIGFGGGIVCAVWLLAALCREQEASAGAR
jgi:MFS family permease